MAKKTAAGGIADSQDEDSLDRLIREAIEDDASLEKLLEECEKEPGKKKK